MFSRLLEQIHTGFEYLGRNFGRTASRNGSAFVKFTLGSSIKVAKITGERVVDKFEKYPYIIRDVSINDIKALTKSFSDENVKYQVIKNKEKGISIALSDKTLDIADRCYAKVINQKMQLNENQRESSNNKVNEQKVSEKKKEQIVYEGIVNCNEIDKKAYNSATRVSDDIVLMGIELDSKINNTRIHANQSKIKAQVHSK